jgi:hypothetical protein
VLFCVLIVCKCVLPPGDNPIAVNKYIISYIILKERKESIDEHIRTADGFGFVVVRLCVVLN